MSQYRWIENPLHKQSKKAKWDVLELTALQYAKKEFLLGPCLLCLRQNYWFQAKTSWGWWWVFNYWPLCSGWWIRTIGLQGFSLSFNTSYLTDSCIVFTLKIESQPKNLIFSLKMMMTSGLDFFLNSPLRETIFPYFIKFPKSEI